MPINQISPSVIFGQSSIINLKCYANNSPVMTQFQLLLNYCVCTLIAGLSARGWTCRFVCTQFLGPSVAVHNPSCIQKYIRKMLDIALKHAQTTLTKEPYRQQQVTQSQV
jgi:hypothetical protein